jgi:hypothetical protein
MTKLEEIAAIGTAAVKRLREQKLAAGQPFLIHSQDLPEMQSYLEYPDRSIRIVAVSSDTRSFTVLKDLPEEKARQIRQEHNLA